MTTPLAPAAAGLGGTALVTGAGGFIGRHLVARLLRDGVRVRAFVRGAPPSAWASETSIDVVRGDLGDADAVGRAVAGVDVVFHVGATMRGDAAAFDRGTVAGTRHVIDSVLAHAVTRLVYVSSLSVLHAAAVETGRSIDESWPLEPHPEARGHYTRTKLAAERLVVDAARSRGLRAVVVRPAEVVGAGATLLTSGVAQRLGRTLVILGDGRVPVPLVAVDDLVDALLTAARLGPFDGTIVHVVDPVAITQNDMVARHLATTGGGQPVIRVPRAMATAAVAAMELAFGLMGRTPPLTRYRLASALAPRQFVSDRASRLWGWRPQLGAEAALDRLVGSMRS